MLMMIDNHFFYNGFMINTNDPKNNNNENDSSIGNANYGENTYYIKCYEDCSMQRYKDGIAYSNHNSMCL